MAEDPVGFEIIGPIRGKRLIAAGRGVKVRQMLRRRYGGRRWRKMKGIATVREETGETYEAEIHWYEAHGIGRCGSKIKGPVDEF
jgi:hypothetical protein